MRRYRKATFILSMAVLLLIVSCCLLGYKLYSYSIEFMNDEADSFVELDTNSVEVKYLFDMAHVDDSCVFLHQVVFDSTKLLANDMISDYKSQLASNYFGNYVSEGAYDENGYSLIYVDEDKVRDAYDLIFGKGAGDYVTSVKYGIYSLKYNPVMRRFDAYVTGGGGWTCDWFQEEVIQAIKYEDRIELITVAWFMLNDKEGIYKDMYGEELLVVDEELSSSTDFTREFVDTYKQQLQTYKYTFNLNDNGFYNYYSVERIKN